MKEAFEFAKDVITLTANVQSLLDDVDSLQEMSLDHERRLVKVESLGPILEEKAKSAALREVLRSFNQISEKFGEISMKVDRIERRVGDGVDVVPAILPHMPQDAD